MKPLKRINPSHEDLYSIFPVATTVLAIGVVVTFFILLIINI
jgi:hypothetical protein